MRDLTGRTVLVTGAGQGVGRAIAVQCAEHGAHVAVNDYYADRAATAAKEIEAAGGTATAAQCDVTDYPAVQAMVEQIGAVDILVNNAGNAGPSSVGLFASPPFWQTEPEDWNRWLGTNFFGVLNVTRAALPGMVERSWGRVITIVSDAGRVGEANLVVYGGAKAGAAGFSRGLAKSVGRHGVTVNCVSLGSMHTEATAEFTGDPVMLKKMLSAYPLRRLGEPDDAAAMVLFLASDEASWITGQTYPVNGGYSSAL